MYCKYCRKNFASERAYNIHSNSSIHKDKVIEFRRVERLKKAREAAAAAAASAAASSTLTVATSLHEGAQAPSQLPAPERSQTPPDSPGLKSVEEGLALLLSPPKPCQQAAATASQEDGPLPAAQAEPLESEARTPEPHASPGPAEPDGAQDTRSAQFSNGVAVFIDPPKFAFHSASAASVSCTDPTLPVSARKLLPILLELHGEKRDALLRLISDPEFTAADVPWKTSQDLHQFLDRKEEWHSKVVWTEQIDGKHWEFRALVRTHQEILLEELVKSPQAAGMKYEARQSVSKDGTRVFTDFASGDWLARKQAEVRSAPHFAKSFVLGMMFYSDAAECARHGHKFHPLIMYLANFTLQHLRSRDGYRRLGLLPILNPKELNMRPDSDRFIALQRRVRSAAIDAVLMPFKEMSFSGFETRCRDGITRHFVPLPAAYISDIKEANEIFHIKPWPAPISDITTLVHKDNLADVSIVPPRRTEELMNQVMAQARDLESSGNSAGAKSALDTYSLSLSRPSPLAGFNLTPNLYDLGHTDRLHQSNRGVAEHILKFLFKSLTADEVRQINVQLKLLPAYPGFKLPSYGLDLRQQATATELANLFKCICIPLMASGFSQTQKFIPAIQELLSFNLLRDIEMHSEESLQALQKACVRAQKACVENLLEYSPTEFRFPKFWRMRTFGASIRDFGSVNLTTTGFGERSHADLKFAMQYTNQHGNLMDEQATRQAARVNVSRKLTQEPPTAAQRLSPAQKAARQGEPVLSETLEIFTYSGGSEEDQNSFRKLFEDSKMVILFQRAFGLVLLNDPAAKLDLHELPKTHGCKIAVANGVGVPLNLHRGSERTGVMLYAGQFGRRNTVAIRGEEIDDVWLAKLHLLFIHHDRSKEAYGQPLAFVSWYIVPARRPRNSRLIQMTRVREEKITIRGLGHVDRCEVISAKRILRPIFLQPDPFQEGFFFRNHFVEQEDI